MIGMKTLKLMLRLKGSKNVLKTLQQKEVCLQLLYICKHEQANTFDSLEVVPKSFFCLSRKVKILL